MEAGLMTLHKSDVHVQHFVESTVDIFYATARGKNITIKVNFSPADPSNPPNLTCLNLNLYSKQNLSQPTLIYYYL